MKIGDTEYEAVPLSPEDLRRFDGWIRDVVRGAMECRFQSEMARAMNEPHALRVLLELVTDCTPEVSAAAITESNALEWAERLKGYLAPEPPRVFKGSAAEQQAAVDAFLKERNGR